MSPRDTQRQTLVPAMEAREKPGPCRLCGQPAYKADVTGPVHPCCIVNDVTGPRGHCPACAGSAAYERRDGNHYSRKARAAETAAKAPRIDNR